MSSKTSKATSTRDYARQHGINRRDPGRGRATVDRDVDDPRTGNSAGPGRQHPSMTQDSNIMHPPPGDKPRRDIGE